MSLLQKHKKILYIILIVTALFVGYEIGYSSAETNYINEPSQMASPYFNRQNQIDVKYITCYPNKKDGSCSRAIMDDTNRFAQDIAVFITNYHNEQLKKQNIKVTPKSTTCFTNAFGTGIMTNCF